MPAVVLRSSIGRFNGFMKLGHVCFGIDFAPAAIAYAKDTARINEEPCDYTLGDLRETDFGEGYGIVMMNNGQLNVFRRKDVMSILKKACDALLPGGLLLLEPQKYETVKGRGNVRSSWYSCGDEGGLFSDRSHLCLNESFWDADTQSATERFFIIDSETGNVISHAMTTEAYTEDQYRDILLKGGFESIRFFPTMVGVEIKDESQSANIAIVSQKPMR